MKCAQSLQIIALTSVEAMRQEHKDLTATINRNTTLVENAIQQNTEELKKVVFSI